MSTESAAEIRARRTDWMKWHRDTYIESDGAKGHIVDVQDVGGLFFQTTVLIEYVGRKSGKVMYTPLCYGDIGGEVVIVASKGGADEHPAWYLNLKAMDEVRFQIGTQAYRATMREPEGEEYQKVWDFMVDVFPPYASYQSSTDRKIPLVMMKAIEEIEPITKDAKNVEQNRA